MKKVLTIAGSDSGGGAGIQADLKAFAARGVYGMSAITALTAQNTVGVFGVFPVTPEFVAQQIDAVMEDLGADAWKTGMLANAAIIQVVAERAGHRCEYCRAPEAIFNFPFEVEHVVPKGRGGADHAANWALSCRACNLHKSDGVDFMDPETQKVVPLFNPRRDRWEEHFRVEDPTGALVGLTPVGRATVDCLRMNRPAQLQARRQWMRLKLFPTL